MPAASQALAEMGRHKQAMERIRRMSVDTSPQELTDTPSLSPRNRLSRSGSMHGSQLNMQTTLDLVLLLLDDIDAGQAISSERTQQLRAILLNDDDLQQPLVLRDLKRKHSQDNSYTGSRVLSFLEQAETDNHLMSAASSFISVRLPFSSHTSRNQSFATGMDGSIGHPPLRTVHESESAYAKEDPSTGSSALQDSNMRMNSGLIRNFVRGARGVSFGELTPVQEAGQASKEPSRELPSCPEEAVDLPSSQAHAVSQPGTPQQSSESAQSIMDNPFMMAEQPAPDTLKAQQQATAGNTGRLRVTIPAESLAQQGGQHPQDAGGIVSQLQPGLLVSPAMSAQQQMGLALDRPHKSLPAHAFAAARSEAVRAARLSRAWQDTEESALPEASPEESDCDSKGPLCAQEQLLRSLITRAGGLLRGAGEWGFDTLELAEVTDGRPLSCLAFCLIQRHGLIKGLRLDEQRLVKFLLEVEDRYPANAYHNRAHAADVLHTVHCTLYCGELVSSGFVSGLEVLACYIAAVVHDVEHPGITNDCLVATAHELAMRYNDRSVLESHHCSTFSRILHDPELDCNFLMKAASQSEQRKLRNIVMEMVLATDMKQHFALVAKFKTLMTHTHATGSSGQQMAQLKWADSLHGMLDLGHRLHSMPAVVDMSHMIRLPLDLPEAQKMLVLQLMLKNADLGHLSHPFALHKKWLDGLEEELFSQGDFEAGIGLPRTPFMDRSLPGISSKQVNFFKLMAIPMLVPFVLAFPGCQPLLDGLMANYSYWCSAEETANKESAPAGQMLRVASLGRSHSLSPLSSPKRASFGSMPRRLCTALGQESSSQDSAAST